eukprot:GFUD01003996.1.p1 GENE.GFUD01003996.1~~GFUD01003996.1.p1  ORF type:complete len:2148 (-),score=343.88 GFUD01003996.1:108-6551(-)
MDYIHKKFKKIASSEQIVSESSPVPNNTPPACPASPVGHNGGQISVGPYEPTLKHSVGNMVGAPRVSVGGAHNNTEADTSDHIKKNVCPYCQLSCPKPSVLEKHIRTHTNERPYPCESCGFSFKTKSNLYKHRKSRTHSLKVEKGIESSSAEIIAELGDSAKEELDIVNPVILQPDLRPDLRSFNVFHGDPNLPPHLPPLQAQIPEGMVLYAPGHGHGLPPHLVKHTMIHAEQPRLPYQGHAFHYPGVPPTFKDPNLRFIEHRPLLNGHMMPEQPSPYQIHHSPQHPQHPPQHVRLKLDHPQETIRAEKPVRPEMQRPMYPPHQGGQYNVQYQPQEMARYAQGAKEARHSESHIPGHFDQISGISREQANNANSADVSKKQHPPHINPVSLALEQRINKVISQNQAIVETLDPFWKGRYMRQSSREGDSSESGSGGRGRGRRYSQTTPASNATSVPHEEAQQQVQDGLRQFNNFSGKSISNPYRDSNQIPTTTLSTNIISNNVPQPPRPDSNIPLNLSDTRRKRKSPENPLMDADSVKEVWLNSQKKTGNISHLEDIASSIEAKLRSSENPFHPENPEGSIIKDLLLKTRASIVQGQVLVAATTRESDQKERELSASGGKLNVIESHRNLIDSNIPLNLQISISNKYQDQPQNVMGIPIPKNFLSQPKPSNSIETSLYQCNLCMVTFKSLESIEVHQNQFCKNSKLITTETGIMRPNSTVSHHPPRASPADRRKSESTGSLGEPPIKRSRSDSLPVIAAPLERGDTIYSRQQMQMSSATTTTHMSHIGLLQIARPGQSTLSRFVHSSKANMKDSSLGIPNIYKTEMSSSRILTEVPTTGFSLPGIPTPNLSGVLTGIKTQPLFSLPGARSDLNPNKMNGLHDGMMKPVYTMSASQEDKPVTFVLGIPGPHSQPSSAVNPALQQMKSQVPSSLPSRSSLMSNLKIETSVTFSTTVSFATVVAGTNDHNFLKPPITLNLQSPVKDRFPGQRQIFHSPQRKYDFPSASKLESPQRPLDISPMKFPPSHSPISTLNTENKPDRPNTLPLAPGALFKKKDVSFSGATLVSPETPRPKKAYVLHYQNGTAYTFLGLKCSTRVFFCSIHKAQPNYVELEKNSRVSMYSNWKVVAKDSHPSGLSPKIGMSCYNSTSHSTAHGMYTTAAPKKSLMITTHSSRWHEKKDSCHSTLSTYNLDGKRAHGSSEEADSARPVRTVEGGYKSADDNYTYIRGRGRGKYICDSCGIRCKKPSMLKKHIRTHTNVRPFTCKYCNFSFKTKGNLTKHMKSKAHSKKCVELGIIPVPTSADDNQMDDSKGSGEIAIAGDSDTDDCDDADDLDEDDEDDQYTEEQFDDASNSSNNFKRNAGTHHMSAYDDTSSILGLAPRAPRFSTYPYVPSVSSISTYPSEVNPKNDGSCLPGPESLSEQNKTVLVSTVSNISEHEQVSRITRLAQEIRDEQSGALSNDPQISLSTASIPKDKYYFSSYGSSKDDQESKHEMSSNVSRTDSENEDVLMPSGSKIWSIAKLTDEQPSCEVGTVQVSRPNSLLLENQQQDSPGTASIIKENPADILSPVTESATILSYINKTSSRVQKVVNPQQVDSLDSPVDTGLKNYLQERAAIRAKQQQSYDNHEFQNKVVIKEEQNADAAQDKQDNRNAPKSTAYPTEFPHSSYSHAVQTDTIPQNVTMNVKDMPPLNSNPGQTPPTPEFNIPHITKADSPLRKNSQSENMKIRTPESINQSNTSRSTDSPASNSSQDNDMPASSSRSDSEKGSLISKTQEIFQTNEDGKSVCGICKKVFSKSSQLRLHVNIHYFERPFRCEACAVSFRTKGHLQKHKRSVGHFNKVNINATFGAPSTDNPRPFKCGDCMIAFRIHGHLAKHLRSKMHIMKLECIGKLPIGMYAEMERLGTNLNEIDTTDCENSLESLQQMAVKLYEKDPSKLTSMDEPLPTVSTSSDMSEDEDSNQAPEIKEEPMEIAASSPQPVSRSAHQTGVQTSLGRGSGWPENNNPSYINIGQSERNSFSSSHEDPSTDSETESGQTIKCQHCSQSFHDMKSLQIHNFLDHHIAESPTPPLVHQSRNSPASSLTNERNPSPDYHSPGLSCHICGMNVPNQTAFQQHLQTHVAFRPYICNHCDAGFTSMSQLENHTRLHQ